jgi:hypothetical protein
MQFRGEPRPCCLPSVPAVCPPQQRALLVGFTTTTCENLNQVLDMNPDAVRLVAIAWLDGFLSGMNLLANEIKKETSIDLATTAFPDAEVRLQWVKSSCRETRNHSFGHMPTNCMACYGRHNNSLSPSIRWTTKFSAGAVDAMTANEPLVHLRKFVTCIPDSSEFPAT